MFCEICTTNNSVLCNPTTLIRFSVPDVLQLYLHMIFVSKTAISLPRSVFFQNYAKNEKRCKLVLVKSNGVVFVKIPLALGQFLLTIPIML